MPDIKAIVFDYGNVLLRWDPRQIFSRFFPDLHAIESFMEEIDFMTWHGYQDRGRSFDDAIAEIKPRFPQYAHMFQAYDDHWSDSITGPIEGSVDILRRLRRAQYPLYGLSNFSAEKFPLARAEYPFFDWFDDMIISGEVGLGKPDPAIYRLLLEKIRRSAQECLFIDDSLPNILAARELGFHAHQFHSPDQLERELASLSLIQPA